MVKVGSVVKYFDEHNAEHNGLVTAVWSQDCINIVHVSNDENKQDQYGRQLERGATSVRRKSDNDGGAGRCFVEIN